MSDHYVCPCPDGCNGCEVPDFARREIELLRKAKKRLIRATKDGIRREKVGLERIAELEERIEKLLASKFAASSPKLIAKIITLASEVEK